MPESILLETSETIATITLNRPDKHNALNGEMITGLHQALLKVKDDDSLRALILTANGKSFSAGADLNWMKESINYSREENIDDAKKLAHAIQALYELSLPTIAAVHGNVFGGALGLVCAADIAIAESNAVFCLSEVKLGLIPAVISPYVVNSMGQRNAKRYFTTAERFSAEKASELGVINEIVANSNDEALRLAEQISQNAPNAVKAAKALVNTVHHQAINDALIEQTSELIADIRTKSEAQDGITAFFAKINPPWV